jgi:hypothetical protein
MLRIYSVVEASWLCGVQRIKQLKQAVAIREKLERLEKELSRIVGDQSSTAKAGAPAPKRKRRKMSAAARAKLSASMKARWAKRKGKKSVTKLVAAKGKGRSPGAPLKERIVGTLKSVGKSGATVKDLAAKLGKSYGNVSVWFHTTGKGIREIKKVGPGKFAWAS